MPSSRLLALVVAVTCGAAAHADEMVVDGGLVVALPAALPTGTSLGVGSIKDGASVSITIDGIGTLTNRLAAAGHTARQAAPAAASAV